MTPRVTRVSVCALVAGVVLSLAPSAFGASAWWHVTAEPVPSVLRPGVAKSEVQEVAATPGEAFGFKGAAFEVLVAGKPVGAFANEPLASELAGLGYVAATEENIQKALEGEEFYGKGGVTVTEEPLGAGGRLKFVVTNVKKGSVPALEVVPVIPQAGQAGEAQAKVLTVGRADGEVVVTATNLGDGEVVGEGGSPVVISDVLPAGFEAVGVSGVVFEGTSFHSALGCSLKGVGGVSVPACLFEGRLEPYQAVTLHLLVNVSGAKSGEEDVASVSGGGARGVSVSRPVLVGGSTPFGLADYELVNENVGGGVDTQAGSHPFQQTTTVIFNQVLNLGSGVIEPAALPKDLHFQWPAGLVGNPASLPRCPLTQFLPEGHCPADTAVGVAKSLVTESNSEERKPFLDTEPLFNLVPSPGEPARLGFFAGITPVYIDPSVRSGRDYGISVNVENITQAIGARSSEVTVWGVPGDSSHDGFRGFECMVALSKHVPCSAPPPIENATAFLSLPTSCTGPLVSTVTGDSWLEREPEGSQRLLASFPMPALDGCDALPFSPEIKVTPDVAEASKPSGLNVDVHVPQGETLNPGGLAVADPRSITVTLPAGVVVNPAGADGLLACSEALAGFTGLDETLNPGSVTPTFTGFLPGSIAAITAVEGHEAPESEGALVPGMNFCPDASKIGEVTIKTPLLPVDQPLKGSVYLAAQNQNPFGSLIAIYLIAEDPVSGTLVRVAGQVHLSETGQLTTTIENSPQAPFEDAELHFFGGERAPLASPAHCGEYTTTASLTPWTAGPAVSVSAPFQITSGPNHTACPPTPLPFNPTLTAYTSNIQAGGFSPFVTTFSRPDGQQDLAGVSLRMPPGMLGLVSSLTPCGEAQANAGTCGPASLIGHTIVSVGVGGDPYSVTGGEVFLTESYKGAPYGLSIVNPAVAGPFNLGKVIVRARIEVDPLTAQLTVTTDGSGPYAIPDILKGIPLQIQHINVTIDREHFIFNPTSCDKQEITGSLTGLEGATSALTGPFQVTNCRSLGFKPKITAATSGHVTKQNGTSFSLKISYPPNPLGKEAWFKEAVLIFPRQLPARLTTLQKACLAATFNHDPETCPPASRVGTMTVATPVLPGLLHGIIYFVSYGGAKFPEAVIVLKGEGTARNVTVDLHAETFISKKGITSATLHHIPGVPFSTVQVNLPAGPYSEFTNNAHPCHETPTLTTTLTSQNNLRTTQTTPLTTTGCHKKHKHHKHHKKHKHP